MAVKDIDIDTVDIATDLQKHNYDDKYWYFPKVMIQKYLTLL